MSSSQRRKGPRSASGTHSGARHSARPEPGAEEADPPLPPGRRDGSGFWFPAAYQQPQDIFSDQQRELQEKQRRIQRRRRTDEAAEAPFDSPRDAAGGDSSVLDTALSAAAARLVDSRRGSD